MTTLRKRQTNAVRVIRACIKQGAPDWVADNYYLIDRYSKPPRVLSRVSDRFVQTIEQYLTETGWKVDETTLCAFLEQNAGENGFSYDELCAALSLLACLAIIRIGDICAEKKNASLLPESVGVLRSLSDIDVSALFESAWRAERVLQENEPDYALCSAETKAAYRRALTERARSSGAAEYEHALSLVSLAKQANRSVGELLFASTRMRAARLVWWSAFVLLFGVCALFAVSRFGWLGFLVLLPLAEGISPLCDRLSSPFCKHAAVPRLELDSVPDHARTVVAVTALLTESTDVYERLERFYHLNRDRNVSFCLLCDLPEADTERTDADDALLQNAKNAIDRLNAAHEARFFLLCRNRTRLENGKYGGKERKRGAVGALICRLMGEEAGILYGNVPQDVRYLLTLDADTELFPGTVRELLGVALHPVGRRYGIIQPAVQTELQSSYRTYFTRLVSGSSGVSFYERACFDRNMSLYGEGIFCGKGLLDVQKFHARALCLPDGKILSHDLPEGGLLRTLLVTDISLPDSVPATPESWYKRAHRWIRGDVQNLFLLSSKYPLSPVSRRQIVYNILRHLTPVCTLAATVIGAFALQNGWDGLLLALFAYAHLLLPFVWGTVGNLFAGKPFLLRHAVTAGFSGWTESVSRLCFDIVSSARYAFVCADAIVRSVWRMCVSKRNLLQWTTAAAGENGSGKLSLSLRKGLLAAAVGCLLFLFGETAVFRLLGVFFFLSPMFLYLLSLPLSGAGACRFVSIGDKERAYLHAHARDHMQFYLDTVTKHTHFLPPDNIQLSPTPATAMRTSPTNIGMYLLSVLAARDLGILDSKETADCLERTLATVEGLPKFHGNLYNWYDLDNLSVIGDGFVSFVDSGNFTVSLVALANGLDAYGDADARFPALAAQCRRIEQETDLSVFYNAKKRLFSLGWDSKQNKCENGCYDLLMSESRTASYYAAASGIVPKKHWYALGRTVTSERGYIGMVSWSGTMFEYLMPQLLLPLYRDSFLEESLVFATRRSRQAAVGKLWGVSESGYFAFDGDLHYRYHAHGIRALALRRDVKGERVIAPYASYLSLAVCPHAAIRNLKQLETHGMYGKYGMYEAFDRTEGRSKNGVAVRSYMAHHVGMGIVAIANALTDNVFVRRFMADPRMNAARGLLQEKLPPYPALLTDDLRAPQKSVRQALETHTVTASESSDVDFCAPKAVLLCKEGFSASVTSLGHVCLRKGNLLLNRCDHDRFSSAHTLTAMFPTEGKADGCTPFFGEGAYSFASDSDSVSLISGSKRFAGRVQFSFSRRADCFRVETQSESRKNRSVLFAFEPVLADEASFSSHPAFSKLFIESEFDETERILYFYRRERKNGRISAYLAVALSDKTVPFTFCTSGESFPAEGINTPDDLVRVPDCKTGICIDPYCIIRTEPLAGGRATLLISAASTKAEASHAIATARHEKEHAQSGMSPTANELLTSILYPHGIPAGQFSAYKRADLWRYGISGDYPLIGLCAGESDMAPAREVLQGFYALAQAGIRTELLLLPEGDGQYFRPAEKKLLSLLEDMELQGFVGVRGGIFLLRREQLTESLSEILPMICTVRKSPKEISRKRASVPMTSFAPPKTAFTPTAPTVPEGALATADGYADKAGYMLFKTDAPLGVRSFVLSGRRCGSIVTASSAGYTFCDNAREHRLTPAAGDPYALSGGERLFWRRGGVLYDLFACADRVFWGKGVAMWEGTADGTEFSVIVFCCAEKPFKIIRVMFSSFDGEVICAVRPVMGNGITPQNVLWKEMRGNALLFRSGHDPAFDCGIGVLYAKGASPMFSQTELYGGKADGFFDMIGLRVQYNYATFVLGGGNESEQDTLLGMLGSLSAETEQQAAEAFANAMLPPIEILTRSPAQNLFVSRFLPYQIAASRFFARASFRQSGGAYGFRDQLQDCLALVYCKPREVREHILRCCSRQYEEGDVQHWWHSDGKGIRSTCSDDLLWLPYVVSDYIVKTGDNGILSEQVGYLSSPPLSGENERYEQPAQSYLHETVRLHCLRAFAAADKRGKHGLILMGICDWNDAFSAVGAAGVGESVFSTFLYVVAANAFVPHLQKEDPDTAKRLAETAKELLACAERHAFDGDRYLRAFCDSGEILGKAGNKECAVDILSQAFAWFAHADKAHCRTALDTAKRELYDPRHRILKLFSPPFDKGHTAVGYIRGYPAGLRENGGQYTHAAVWGAKAFAESGNLETALDILTGSNPFCRTATRAQAEHYKSEPYALCADIYGGALAGRGGWSWYTGSAAWYYKVFLEDILGIRLSADNRVLELHPRISYEATLSYHGKVRIKVTSETEDTLDGKPAAFPISLSDGEHLVTAKLRA